MSAAWLAKAAGRVTAAVRRFAELLLLGHGPSAHAFERRTKEVALREVMGALRIDLLRFLDWQFARPVLFANLVAWPCAYIFVRRWLEGFSYHINLSLWMFGAAGALALVIALGTVAGYSIIVARTRPVEALRYE